MENHQLNSVSGGNNLDGNRLTLYAYIVVIIVITTIPIWWFNSRTGNPVSVDDMSQDPELQDRAYAESVIQLNQIKKGTIGTAPMAIDYRETQKLYDKAKEEWNAK